MHALPLELRGLPERRAVVHEDDCWGWDMQRLMDDLGSGVPMRGRRRTVAVAPGRGAVR
jgi:hypothetical protein